ncbi:uncharacterized protein SPPG_00616 [Spizellomyces punctatus DAOM BR117]|uniref:Uncharacterized protein n=1 Tax=Spizellomyces punctatus (strain DAOM BR117) TaxID=645134 RepID=A0A0L0HVJ0_SPIPD|nr:uncharacterized protein SPPG_00616 [Spizellomyces punctatus DAOM BR117]KND04925.1 hypothetical protein SPPG_00616 [Spizellomyces punctatus DAOM BR117]|eukprot:XP_016612964.1 hypothetical protein SPPG_00616 [Spizellomyces punctatus DAOM BR117]
MEDRRRPSYKEFLQRFRHDPPEAPNRRRQLVPRSRNDHRHEAYSGGDAATKKAHSRPVITKSRIPTAAFRQQDTKNKRNPSVTTTNRPKPPAKVAHHASQTVAKPVNAVHDGLAKPVRPDEEGSLRPLSMEWSSHTSSPWSSSLNSTTSSDIAEDDHIGQRRWEWSSESAQGDTVHSDWDTTSDITALRSKYFWETMSEKNVEMLGRRLEMEEKENMEDLLNTGTKKPLSIPLNCSATLNPEEILNSLRQRYRIDNSHSGCGADRERTNKTADKDRVTGKHPCNVSGESVGRERQSELRPKSIPLDLDESCKREQLQLGEPDEILNSIRRRYGLDPPPLPTTGNEREGAPMRIGHSSISSHHEQVISRGAAEIGPNLLRDETVERVSILTPIQSDDVRCLKEQELSSHHNGYAHGLPETIDGYGLPMANTPDTTPESLSHLRLSAPSHCNQVLSPSTLIQPPVHLQKPTFCARTQLGEVDSNREFRGSTGTVADVSTLVMDTDLVDPSGSSDPPLQPLELMPTNQSLPHVASQGRKPRDERNPRMERMERIFSVTQVMMASQEEANIGLPDMQVQPAAVAAFQTTLAILTLPLSIPCRIDGLCQNVQSTKHSAQVNIDDVAGTGTIHIMEENDGLLDGSDQNRDATPDGKEAHRLQESELASEQCTTFEEKQVPSSSLSDQETESGQFSRAQAVDDDERAKNLDSRDSHMQPERSPAFIRGIDPGWTPQAGLESCCNPDFPAAVLNDVERSEPSIETGDGKGFTGCGASSSEGSIFKQVTDTLMSQGHGSDLNERPTQMEGAALVQQSVERPIPAPGLNHHAFVLSERDNVPANDASTVRVVLEDQDIDGAIVGNATDEESHHGPKPLITPVCVDTQDATEPLLLGLQKEDEDAVNAAILSADLVTPAGIVTSLDAPQESSDGPNKDTSVVSPTQSPPITRSSVTTQTINSASASASTQTSPIVSARSSRAAQTNSSETVQMGDAATQTELELLNASNADATISVIEGPPIDVMDFSDESDEILAILTRRLHSLNQELVRVDAEISELEVEGAVG